MKMSVPSSFRTNTNLTASSLTKAKNCDPRYRSSLRGLKRCPSCGEYNAQRAQICRNENCELRRKTLAARLPFDPIQLVTHTGAKLYSLRAKKHQPHPRNFVKITEITLALEAHTQSSIVSLDCVCYTDTCKYDSYDAAGITCKHIKACQSVGGDGGETQIPNAEVYQVAREVLWNLNISAEQKQRLWDAYKVEEREVPAVQRLNAGSFAVKCVQSKVFPAGRLHVTVLCGNSVSSSSTSTATMPPKKVTHACACKKLKIILEPDNSVVMQEEICDHLLLVLAGILSTTHGKTLYGNFISALKSFWMPSALETPVGDVCSNDADAFLGLSINIGGNFRGGDEVEAAADDIFIFGDEFLTDDNIPDFYDILDLGHTGASAVSSQASSTLTTPTRCASIILPDLLHTGDPNLVSSCCDINETSSTLTTPIRDGSLRPQDLLNTSDPNLVSSCCDINEVDDDVGIKFHNVTAATTIAAAAPLSADADSAATHLELSDCNIELMDQFQLTDQIDLYSESTELFNANDTGISILGPPPALNLLEQSSPPLRPLPVAIIALDATNTSQNHAFFGGSSSGGGGTSLLKSSAHAAPLLLPLPPPPPPIELPTIAVVKKCPVKVMDSVHAVKSRKYPQIPRKRELIVNSTQNEDVAVSDADLAVIEPTLAYSAWLDYVIERVNDSVDITEDTHVAHSFHVHEEIFAHFSKSFSVGTKRRVPNTTVVVKQGRYKGLIKYAWYFSTASTVRRIFTSKNISLVEERFFECNKEGCFVPYVRKESVFNDSTQHKRIHPKLALYKAHIWFESNNRIHKSGVKLEWLPNAFPKSHYGILNIEFSIGVKEPPKL